MPSPFPGVDPFVEASGRWLGFHNILIAHCSELLNEDLPLQFAAFVDGRQEESESYIDVVSLPSHELVTRIEILTETQKGGEGLDRYLTQRRALAGRGINLVEIDLLLIGERLPMRASLPVHDYYALISPGDRQGRIDVYPWWIRDALPVLPIPLTTPDSFASLSIPVAYKSTFDRGRYDRLLRYDLPIPECLAEKDRMWAIERLRAAGKHR